MLVRVCAKSHILVQTNRVVHSRSTDSLITFISAHQQFKIRSATKRATCLCMLFFRYDSSCQLMPQSIKDQISHQARNFPLPALLQV